MDLNKLAELVAQILDPTLKKGNQSIISLLVAIIIISIVAFTANVILQLYLKSRDYKYIIKTKRADRTLAVFQELFAAMEETTNLLITYNPSDSGSTSALHDRTKNLRRAASINRLSLTKASIAIVDEFADYCSVLATDLRRKDIKVEDKLLERFSTEYKKL